MRRVICHLLIELIPVMALRLLVRFSSSDLQLLRNDAGQQLVYVVGVALLDFHGSQQFQFSLAGWSKVVWSLAHPIRKCIYVLKASDSRGASDLAWLNSDNSTGCISQCFNIVPYIVPQCRSRRSLCEQSLHPLSSSRFCGDQYSFSGP